MKQFQIYDIYDRQAGNKTTGDKAVFIICSSEMGIKGKNHLRWQYCIPG